MDGFRICCDWLFCFVCALDSVGIVRGIFRFFLYIFGFDFKRKLIMFFLFCVIDVFYINIICDFDRDES